MSQASDSRFRCHEDVNAVKKALLDNPNITFFSAKRLSRLIESEISIKSIGIGLRFLAKQDNGLKINHYNIHNWIVRRKV